MSDDNILPFERQLEELEEQVKKGGRDIGKRELTDFMYDESQDAYWDLKSGELLKAAAVDGAVPTSKWPMKQDPRSKDPMKKIPEKPSAHLNRFERGTTVQSATWWPGKPRIIEDHVFVRGHMKRVDGYKSLNLYNPPNYDRLKDNETVDLWLEHVERLFPDKRIREHFYDWAAFAIQHPDKKINHGILISGAQGIGKDSMLLPLRMAVGESNATEIGPDEISSNFNNFVKSVLIVINEVRPHKNGSFATSFYNRLKPILAAPPEQLKMEAKYQNPIYVQNVCRVVMTTNDPLDMYIPDVDRRIFVMHSNLPSPKNDPKAAPYYRKLHRYLANGGCDAVIRWLLKRDVIDFDPSEPPFDTDGKTAIIEANKQVRRSFADDILDEYMEAHPTFEENSVIFTKDLIDFSKLFDDHEGFLADVKQGSFIHKMGKRGYRIAKKDKAKWRSGKWQSTTAYVRMSVPMDEEYELVMAAARLRSNHQKNSAS